MTSESEANPSEAFVASVVSSVVVSASESSEANAPAHGRASYSPAQLAPSRSGDELTISVAVMGAPRRNVRVVSENALRTSADDAKNASASRSGVQAISYSNATGARDSSFRESFPIRSGPRAPSPQHSMPPASSRAWSTRRAACPMRSA